MATQKTALQRLEQFICSTEDEISNSDILHELYNTMSYEREQLKDAYLEGRACTESISTDTVDNWFNETYGNDGEQK